MLCRFRMITSIAVLVSGMALAGCSDDDDNVCKGITQCAAEGTACDGNTLVVCAANSDGCLVETTTNCESSEQVCDDSGQVARCANESCDDPECEGRSDGDSYCDDASVVSCEEDTLGCLVATVVDCSTTSQICDDTTGDASCIDELCDDPACEGRSTGDSYCNNDVAVFCIVDNEGCLQATLDDCSTNGDVCDDSESPVICRTPCSDECQTDGERFCTGNILSVCEDTDNDGCLEFTVTDCALTGVCDVGGDPVDCVAQGSGDSCANAFVVVGHSATFSGADFLVAYPTNAHNFNAGTDCSTTGTGGGVEAVFKVHLAGNDTLLVTEHGGIDVIMHIVEADPANCLDTTSCLASTDYNETDGIYHVAVADQTVYVVVEAWYASPSIRDYEIRIEVTPEVCGDGRVGPTEACDDGNMANNDGCSSDCSTVESGYECQPGLCYPIGAGDTCANPIPITPGTYAFDTTGFTGDYTGYNGACGASMTAAGPDAVFSIEVADGDVVEILDTDSIGFDAVVVLATDCADILGSCIQYGDTLETAFWTNTSGAPQTVFLIIDGYYDTSAGSFQFTLVTRTPTCGDGVVEGLEACDDGNTNDNDGCTSDCSAIESGYECQPGLCYLIGLGETCMQPIPITPGTYAFDTTGFTNDYTGYGGACGTNRAAAGPEAVFAVDLADGDILEVVDTDSIGFDAVVVLATDCADILGSCVQYGDQPETALYFNDTGAAQTVFVIIDGYYSSSEGVFEFTLSTRTPICGDGIVESTEECDDMNPIDSDGCSSSCEVETGYSCVGQPSLCGVSVTETSTPAAPIPDANSTGVSDQIAIASACTLVGVTVDVNITHTYIGDLTLTLTAPDGSTSVVLHNQSGGGNQNIIGNYPMTLTPSQSLGAFQGVSGQGNWTLTVADTDSGDTGTLNSWGLNLICN